MIERLREWARGHTERKRYSPVGIAFHWIMAGLIIFQIGWGWYMAQVSVGADKVAAFETHSAIGLPILVLACLRFIWRMMVPGPVNDADTPGWQSKSAYAIHYVFYICFFGLPLSGWAMWSSLGQPGPLYLGGVVPWPQLPLQNLSPEQQYWVMDVAEDVHHFLVLVLVLIVPLHVGAALKHHFWDRHDVLTGMLPEIEDSETPRARPTSSAPGSQSPQPSTGG